MGPEEFDSWRAYLRVSPPVEERLDAMLAALRFTMVKLWGDSKRTGDLGVEDFYPDWWGLGGDRDRDPKEDADPDALALKRRFEEGCRDGER